jgi:hypothetical protein
MSSAKAVLYKIDPRSNSVSSLSVGQPRAARPEILPVYGAVEVRLTSGGPPYSRGTTHLIGPSPMIILNTEFHGPPSNFQVIGQFGSAWWYDRATGRVWRQTGASSYKDIQATATAGELEGGPCLTSITAGARSIWVTIAAERPTAACPS